MKFNIFLNNNKTINNTEYYIHGLLGQTGQKSYHFDKKHPIEGKVDEYEVSDGKYSHDFKYDILHQLDDLHSNNIDKWKVKKFSGHNNNDNENTLYFLHGFIIVTR